MNIERETEDVLILLRKTELLDIVMYADLWYNRHANLIVQN